VLLLLDSGGVNSSPLSSPRKLSSSQPDFGAVSHNHLYSTNVASRSQQSPNLSTSVALLNDQHLNPANTTIVVTNSDHFHGRFAEQMFAAQTAADVERILQHSELRKPFQVFVCFLFELIEHLSN
jgi:hypothetical protein